jgi:hypothetical protein
MLLVGLYLFVLDLDIRHDDMGQVAVDKIEV